MRAFLLLAVAGVMALSVRDVPVEPPPRPAAPRASLHPERRGIGLLPVEAAPSKPGLAPEPAPEASLDARRSLAVTDEVILARFSFEEVMNRLAEQSGIPGLTGLRLYQEWWDSQRKAPGLRLGGPHCGDQTLPDGKPGFNGFAYACPRAEGVQAVENPFLEPATNPAAYVPIGLFNRFDLAARDGSDCGEYRIVFARRSGISDPQRRNLIAFEGVLPNPRPKKGISGCRKVVRFWAELSREPDAAVRAEALHRFYFEGLGRDLPPVVHIDNFGNATDRATGQVRTNQFMQSIWTLREFRVRKRCSGDSCVMRFEPDTVKTNPAGVLFSSKLSHPLKEDFSEALLSQVEALATNDLFRYTVTLEDRFNSGQSHSSGTENLYVHQLGNVQSPLRTKLQQRLNSLSSSLTPMDIVARAQTLSCAGCHQLSTGAKLGGGLTWPFKSTLFTFVHVSERTLEEGPDGPRYGLSEALAGTFLPNRQQLMEAFLARRPPFDTPPDDGDLCSVPALASQAGHAREVLGTASNFSQDRAHSREPRVEVGGDHVFTAWIDMRTGYGDVYFRKSADRGLTFSEPQKLSDSPARASNVRVTRFQANVYVVWVEDGIRLRTSHDFGVTFGPIQVLSALGRAPRIVAAGTNVYVAWSGSKQAGELLLRASHDSGDSFEAAVELSAQARGGDLELAAEGSHVYAVWDNGSQVFFRRSADEARSFESTQVLDEGSDASEDARLATRAGGVYVVWREGSGCRGEIAFRRSTTGGASFEPILNLSQNAVASLDPLIDSHNKSVYVIWKEKGAGNTDIFFTRSQDEGVTFGAPMNVSETPGKSSQYALSAPGEAVRIVWREKSTSGGDILHRSSANRGASFGEVQNLSQSEGSSTSPVIISSGRGAEMHVLWEEDLPGNREIFYRRGVPVTEP